MMPIQFDVPHDLLRQSKYHRHIGSSGLFYQTFWVTQITSDDIWLGSFEIPVAIVSTGIVHSQL